MAEEIAKKESLKFSSTREIPVPKGIVGQVIGQEKSVEIIRKAAAQKRNVLLIGLPGTGKSMIAAAMAEILPISKLQDVLVYPNERDPNNPKIVTVAAGEGKKISETANLDSKSAEDNARMLSMVLSLGFFLISFVLWSYLKVIPDVVYAATLILGGFVFIASALGSQIKMRESSSAPKLLVDNSGKKTAPFIEATGARAGALLGDVRHDPLQSFVNVNELIIIQKGVEKKISFEKFWNKIAKNYPELVEKHEKGYEVIVLPKNEEVFTFGVNEKGEVIKTRIYSMNKRPYEGEVIELSADKSKLVLTPEHKVIMESGRKEAGKISKVDQLIVLKNPF